jgi:hypothetical protein
MMLRGRVLWGTTTAPHEEDVRSTLRGGGCGQFRLDRPGGILQHHDDIVRADSVQDVRLLRGVDLSGAEIGHDRRGQGQDPQRFVPGNGSRTGHLHGPVLRRHPRHLERDRCPIGDEDGSRTDIVVVVISAGGRRGNIIRCAGRRDRQRQEGRLMMGVVRNLVSR